MSLIFAEALRSEIEKNDNSQVVKLLESRVREGVATEAERLLCGVLLLLPPHADYEASAKIFGALFGGDRRFEAAVWDAYRLSVLLPDGDRSCEKILQSAPGSAVAAHMIGLIAASNGDYPLALKENRRSRSIRLFPFNVVEALKYDAELSRDVKNDLWRSACDLIISRSAEHDVSVSTVEGALQRRWENLILGSRLTSYLWLEMSGRFESDNL
jgi:hypothetical protein